MPRLLSLCRGDSVRAVFRVTCILPSLRGSPRRGRGSSGGAGGGPFVCLLTMQNRGLARASQTCLNLAERKRFRGRKNIGPDIREFFGRRTRRGVNPSFLMQRCDIYFWHSDLMQSSAKFVQAESNEKFAYSLPRRRRTKGA